MKTSLNFLNDEPRFPCPHGTMVTKVADGRLRRSECHKCCEEHEEKELEKKTRADRKYRFESTMHLNNFSTIIPKRFIGKTLENYQTKNAKQKNVVAVCQKYVQNFDHAKENGTSIVFCGKPGTGKTHLAYAIILKLREKYHTAVMRTALDMTADVKDAFKSEKTTPSEVVLQYAQYDVLVVDEVGVQVSSEAEKRIFFDIINKRYENMLPTIMISNLERNELSMFVGQRVMDRMNENGGVVCAFDWESYR